jgi:hypothetical protein
MVRFAKKKKKTAPIHGTRAGHKAKVEQGEDEDGAKTLLALDHVSPSQILPVLFCRVDRWDSDRQPGLKKCFYLCCQRFNRW